jgi:hypothetical protein
MPPSSSPHPVGAGEIIGSFAATSFGMTPLGEDRR